MFGVTSKVTITRVDKSVLVLTYQPVGSFQAIDSRFGTHKPFIQECLFLTL